MLAKASALLHSAFLCVTEIVAACILIRINTKTKLHYITAACSLTDCLREKHFCK